MAEQLPTDTVVETVKTVKGTLKWAGNGGLSNPTPSWALWIFRIEFILNKVFVFILGSSSLFTANEVKESLVWIAAIDLATWLFAKQFGIKKEDIEN